MMHLRHIEVFTAIYENGSINSAAKLLHISQPSVSKLLRLTEDRLGFKLFDRVGRGLIITEEGHKLYSEVCKVTRQLEQLKQSIRNIKDKRTQHIRIVMITGLGFNITPIAIARFRELFPNVTFELSTEHFSNLCQAILERRADIGLVFQPPSHPNIKSVKLGIGEFACVSKNELSEISGQRVSLHDLKNRPFISMTEEGPLGTVLASAMIEQGVEIKPSIIAETGFVAVSLVKAGLGNTIIDEFSAKALIGEQLAYKKLTPPIHFSVNGLYSKNNPVSELCLEFLECFKNVYSV